MMLFRRTNRYGYSRYYGNGGSILRIVKIVLFVLVLLAVLAGIAVWGLHRYVVYDEDGAHLVLPWMTEDDGTENPDPEGTAGGGSSSGTVLPEVIVQEEPAQEPSTGTETGGETGGASSGVTPEEETPAAEPLSQLLAERVARDSLSNAAALVQSAGGNAALVYLKTSSGAVYVPTSNGLAERISTVADSASGILEQVTTLEAQGVQVVAYLDCFRDNSVGASSSYALLTTGGSRWQDGDGRAWTDPANEEVQDYLASLVKALAQADVTEVVLCNAAYPTSGNTDTVAAAEDRAAVITAFYQKLAAAVDGTETLVSVFTDSETITAGSNALSGQTLTAIAQLNGRLWVSDSTDAETLQSALSAAGITGLSSDRLCLSVKTLDASSTVSQFALDE